MFASGKVPAIESNLTASEQLLWSNRYNPFEQGGRPQVYAVNTCFMMTYSTRNWSENDQQYLSMTGSSHRHTRFV